jgi:WD40 repeat protein
MSESPSLRELRLPFTAPDPSLRRFDELHSSRSPQSNKKLIAGISALLILGCIIATLSCSSSSSISSMAEINVSLSSMKSSKLNLPTPKPVLSLSKLAQFENMHKESIVNKSKDYKYLAYITKEKKVAVVNLKDSSLLFESAITSSGSVQDMEFTIDNKFLAVVADKVLSLLSLESKSEIHAFNYTESIYSIQVSNDNQHLILEGDTSVALWNLATRTVDHEYVLEPDVEMYMTLSPDQKYMLIANENTNAGIWDLQTKGEIKAYTKVDMGYSSEFSNDNKYIAFAGLKGFVYVFNFESQTLVASSRHSGEVTCSAFTEDNKYFVTGDKTGEINVLNLEKGKEEGELYYSVGLNTIVVSKNDKKIVSGDVEGTLKVFDLETKYEEVSLQLEEYIDTIEISEDGDYIIFAFNYSKSTISIYSLHFN